MTDNCSSSDREVAAVESAAGGRTMIRASLAMFDGSCDGDWTAPRPKVFSVEEWFGDGKGRVVLTPDSDSEDDSQVNDRSGPVSIMQTPGPQKSHRPEVWHYTTASGLMGILSSNSLWATSMAFLNDTSEYEYGIALFEEELEALSQSRFVHPSQKEFARQAFEEMSSAKYRLSTYVACASIDGDSLAQWRAYSGQGGYAISLPSKVDVLVVDPTLTSEGARPFQVHGWTPVVYDPENQRDLVKKTLGFVVYNTPLLGQDAEDWDRSLASVASLMATNICYLKHPSFHEEQEVRAIFRKVEATEAGTVHRRETPYGIAPYVELCFSQSTEGPVRSVCGVAERLPLLGVRVAPHGHSASAALGVESLLETHELDAPVHISGVPLR